MPQSWTLPARSACWAWITATSGLSALTAASRSPVKGHAIDPDRVGLGDEVAARVAAKHGEGQPRRARGVPIRHPRVAVLLELERRGPAALDRVAEAVEAADARVAAPGEDEAAGAAHADHLVVDHVGRHPHEREIAPPLTDDLVAGRERNKVRESLQRDGVAVADELGDPVSSGTISASRRVGGEPFGSRTIVLRPNTLSCRRDVVNRATTCGSVDDIRACA